MAAFAAGEHDKAGTMLQASVDAWSHMEAVQLLRVRALFCTCANRRSFRALRVRAGRTKYLRGDEVAVVKSGSAQKRGSQ
jgi:hypothetical protein